MNSASGRVESQSKSFSRAYHRHAQASERQTSNRKQNGVYRFLFAVRITSSSNHRSERRWYTAVFSKRECKNPDSGLKSNRGEISQMINNTGIAMPLPWTKRSKNSLEPLAWLKPVVAKSNTLADTLGGYAECSTIYTIYIKGCIAIFNLFADLCNIISGSGGNQ